MAISEEELVAAEERIRAQREAGYAISARYDRRSSRIVIGLNTDVQIAIPAKKVEGLSEASAEDLTKIEISPTGLGLYWPKLDIDIYVPGLLQGVFGSKRWMAAHLGSAGGKVRSETKTAAARENGRKGGRPKRISAN